VTTPAGWYPDPEGSPGQRFWSGDAWTDHYAPDAPPGVVGATHTTSRGPDKRLLIGLAAAAVVVLIVGAVVAVVLTMKNDAGDITVTPRPAEASSAAPSETEEEGPTEPQAAGTGEEVREGNLAFVVNGVETTDVIAHPEHPDVNTTAEGEYVIVHLTVTNVSTETQTFYASSNTLSDGTIEFEADAEAWLYLGETVTDLAPGDTIETTVVFDVPKGTDLESIRLRDGLFADGVVVGL
jgi:hypothetical protein